MEANMKPRVDVTYWRHKHGRGFTWTAVIEFGGNRGAKYPTSGPLATVALWVAEVIESKYACQEVDCVSQFEFPAGRTGTDAAVRRSATDIAVAGDETATSAALSALPSLGLHPSDVDYILEVAGQRVVVPADLKKHSGAGSGGRPWLGSVTGRVMQRWRTREAS
ncbi:hypothetical protein [Streptomyces sp. NPDC051665]|uniref:hypothetical protein n=1 Tax=Streptomyces sp. NPDC051665 TaxID=3154647 RepID=UPI0034338A58